VPFSWPLAVLFVLGAAVLKVSSGAVTAVLAVCVAWALIGPKQAIQSMALAVLIEYWNPELATLGPLSGVLVRLVLLIAAIRVLPSLRATDIGLLWPLWMFSLLAALTSASASPAVTISIMKVITFVVASSTALVAFSRLTQKQTAQVRSWLMTLALIVGALSALTLLRPAIAYQVNGRGLQGVLSHPQALGTLLAPFAAWSLAGLMLARERVKVTTIAITVGLLIIIFLTQARTAAVAVLLGVTAAVLTRLFRKRRALQAPALRMVWVPAIGAAALVVASLMSGKLVSMFTGFVLKRTTETTVSQAFLESRGYSMVSQWANFLSAPLTGHGFGVYADGVFPSGVSQFAGIPISAPVEKGFVPTAVLEETGLLGGLLFYFAIFWLGRQAWRSSDLRWIAMFVGALAVNLGEAVIMSPGGMGLVVWLVIGLSCFAFRLERRTAKPSTFEAPTEWDASDPRRATAS